VDPFDITNASFPKAWIPIIQAHSAKLRPITLGRLETTINGVRVV